MADRLDQTQLDILRAMDSIEVSGLVSKQYVAAEKRVVFSRGATVKLNLRLASHYTVVTFAKRDALIAWFDVDDFTDDYVADDITFIDLNTKKVISGKPYTFKYQTTGMKSVYGEGPDPIGEVKGKIWVPFTRLSELPSKKMRIGLFTDIAVGDRIEWVIKKDGFEVKEWALVEGTNLGFVTSAPSADPAGPNSLVLDSWAWAFKVTSPADATTITEMGFYTPNSGGSGVQIEVGLYEHQDDTEGPYNKIYSQAGTGSGAGWNKVTGLDWSISPSTAYWLAVQMDAHTGTTYLDANSTGSYLYSYISSTTALPDPWTPNVQAGNRDFALYALYEAGGNPPNGNLHGPFSGCFGGPV